MRRRNPSCGCLRIAQQIALAFAVDIDKDVVRRVLMVHYRPESDSGGPSWLTFIGHMNYRLWSCDLFRIGNTENTLGSRCDGPIYATVGIVDGVALCRMFHRAIRGHSLPKYLSSDHDPLYRFHQWQANLRVLDITEVKSVPYEPLSHPFKSPLKRRGRPPKDSSAATRSSGCSNRQETEGPVRRRAQGTIAAHESVLGGETEEAGQKLTPVSSRFLQSWEP
jgi:hypothetical protein